ncbi:hypothetical protein J6TS2_41690 [Heyndrickxia sporothermodurans]|nr:hypothetical protein J6TS2_41690 [Heyndrickxia sporothermodurans]
MWKWTPSKQSGTAFKGRLCLYMDRDAFYIGSRLMKIYFYINTNERSEVNVSAYEGRY